MTTKIVPCPQCDREGESHIEDRELACPFCGHQWTHEGPFKVRPQFQGLCSKRSCENRCTIDIVNEVLTLPPGWRVERLVDCLDNDGANDLELLCPMHAIPSYSTE